jgi:hypothetical protein
MVPRVLLAVFFVLMYAGCSSNERGILGEEIELGPATQFTGVLHAGILAIGGEHTGWVLQGDGQSGGIEVDVSAVITQAKALDGKRGAIRGRMSEKNYPQRGATRIFVAEEIQEEKGTAPDERLSPPMRPIERIVFT